MIFLTFLLLEKMDHKFIKFKGFYVYVDARNILHENHKGIDTVLHTNVKNIYEITDYALSVANTYLVHFIDGTHVIIEKEVKFMENSSSLYFWILSIPLVKQFYILPGYMCYILSISGELHIYRNKLISYNPSGYDKTKYHEIIDNAEVYLHTEYNKTINEFWLWCSSGKLIVKKMDYNFEKLETILDQPGINMPVELDGNYI